MKLPVGRENIARLFENCILKNRLANCYILSGEAGIGKKTVTEYILSVIFCNAHASCGKCASCHSLRERAHPDVLYINRDPNRASIGIDKIRDMMGDVFLKPLMSEYKAVVINEAHLLTTEAQNAMLKIIEEPPKGVVFFLLCDTVSTILQTVCSRSVEIVLRPLSNEELRSIASDSIPDHAINLCRGNPMIMQKLADDKEYMQMRSDVMRAFSEITSDDMYSPFQSAKFFVDLKEKKDEVFEIILSFLRDVMYKKLGMESEIINTDKSDMINSFASGVTSASCSQMLDTVFDIWKSKGKNGNYNMAITIMLLKCREEINDRRYRNKI